MMRSETEEEEALFFPDIAKRNGRFRRLLLRTKWILVSLLLFFVLLLILGVIPGSKSENSVSEAVPLQSSASSINPQIKLSQGHLEIYGDSSKPTISIDKTTNFFQYFDHFPGILSSIASIEQTPKSIKSIEIKWYKIDGPKLSLELSQFPNLEILHLDNVTIFNELQPTPLPNLKELYINQMVEPGQPENFQFYADGYSSYLSSAFFFLNDLHNSTDFNTNLIHTKVNISIWLTGSIVFSVDPVAKKIGLDMSNCRPLLENSTLPYTSVTLGTCNDLLPTSIAPKTLSLNLYLVSVITTDFLSVLWPNVPMLEELFIEVVDFQVEINMAELPKSLKLFSASSIRLTGSSDLVLPNLQEFYFGGENQYGWVEVKDTEISNNGFLHNFGKMFPKIDKVGIFELRDGRYNFLKSVLNSTVTNIVVQGFQRPKNTTGSAPQVEGQNQTEIEAFLTGLGLPPTAEFFVLERKAGKWIGRTIDWNEQIRLRYKMLGWDAIDNWDKYVHVRRLLDGGFMLTSVM